MRQDVLEAFFQREKEFFRTTAYTCSYQEFRSFQCMNCERFYCIHRGAFRRVPKKDGGLGLCPNLEYADAGECGVLVELNGTVKAYWDVQNAVSELQKAGRDDMVERIERGRFFVSDRNTKYQPELG